MNIKQVHELFKSIAEKHFLINSFDCIEQVEQQLSGENLYPKFTLEQPFNYVPINNIKEYNIAFLILDLSKLDESDEIDIISKCGEIADDIIEYLKNNDYEISTPNILSMNQFGNDNTSGVRVEFSLKVLNNKSRCYLPFAE